MIVFSILGFTSIILSGGIFYLTGLYDTWYFYFIPILILPIIYVLLFGLYIAALWFFSLFLSMKKEIKKPNSFYYFFIRQTCFGLLILFRARIHKTNLDLLPKKRCLIITNHQSNFDPMIPVYYAKNHPLICVTKPENMNIPILGKFLHNAGFIPINRENNFEGIKAITKATSYIKDDLSSIYICPEGTRNKGEGLLEFHAGSFKIAYKAKCPIVITSLRNTRKIAKNFPFKRTHVYYDVLKVLEYEDYKDKSTQEISDYAKELILNQINIGEK